MPIIEINTLEDLLEFQKEVCEELVLINEYTKFPDGRPNEYTIEIYDDYRE